MPSKLFLYIVSVVSLLLLCNCSRLDIAANYADVFLTHRAAQYFDLNSEQKKDLKRQIASEISTTRKSEVPLLCRSLEKDRSLISSYEMFSEFKLKTQERLEPKVQNFVTSLNEKQWQHFKNKVHADIQSKMDEIPKYHKKHKQSFHKHLRNAVGSLSSQQKDLINRFFESSPYPRKSQLQSWALITELKSHQHKDWIRSYFRDPEKIMTQEYQDELKIFKQNLTALLKELDRSLSTSQSSNLKKYLEQKCEELS